MFRPQRVLAQCMCPRQTLLSAIHAVLCIRPNFKLGTRSNGIRASKIEVVGAVESRSLHVSLYKLHEGIKEGTSFSDAPTCTGAFVMLRKHIKLSLSLSPAIPILYSVTPKASLVRCEMPRAWSIKQNYPYAEAV